MAPKMVSMVLGRQTHCLMAFALLASSILAGGGSEVVLRAMALLDEQEPLPPPAAAGSEEQYLVEHNVERAAVKVGPLLWSPKLAATAGRLVRYQRMKKRCNFADLGSDQYGANQASMGSGAGPAEAVRLWVEEAKYYNYATDTCAGGHECGAYKQVVWRKTAELGCAQATCDRAGPTVRNGGNTRISARDTTLTICLYFPPGNFVGEKPY